MHKYEDIKNCVEAREAVDQYESVTSAAKELGIARSTLRDRYKRALEHNYTKKDLAAAETTQAPEERIETDIHKDTYGITYHGKKITTPEELLADCEVDLNIWEVERIVTNSWEVAGKKKDKVIGYTDSDGNKVPDTINEELWKTPLRQIKIYLKRKKHDQVAIENFIKRIESNAPAGLSIAYPKSKKVNRRSLEVCIMDPHFGMLCNEPEANGRWDLETCETVAMWAISSILEDASKFGNFEEVIFPFGNDFLHHDNLSHTTTAGTLQPEGLPYHSVYERGIDLAVTMVNKLREVAPVRVLQIPGNHDRQTSYTMGHVLAAYYRNDKNVSVDASASPYKFYRYGVNLLGFDHGHSIKPIRLAAIMANERKQDWAETLYREWHLGDQHRKGTAKPSSFEEQGVAIEYLPSLTPPNEWHKLHGYNWQQRGALGFIWDFEHGPAARLHVNLNSYPDKSLRKR